MACGAFELSQTAYGKVFLWPAGDFSGMQARGITRVGGLSVGHYTDLDAATGCTVVLCEDGAMGGVDVRGASPGTRETDLLGPAKRGPAVNAVVLSGGSAFGLDSASGVVRFLEERGVGLRVGEAIVPIVPAAILFDLGLVTGTVRPGAEEGYKACLAAASGAVAEGSVGAGTGATVGKLLGPENAVKGGLGTSAIDLGGGLVVGAIVATNAIGGIYDLDTGQVVAGPRTDGGVVMEDAMAMFTADGFSPTGAAAPTSNTTIGVVATNAALTEDQAHMLASAAHDGLALAVRPAHLYGDGDTMFALATGEVQAPDHFNRVLAAGVLSVSRAIVRGVLMATGLGGIPAVGELGAT